MVPDHQPTRSARLKSKASATVSSVAILPVRTWFNRWFRSVSDHVSEVGADTQQVVLRTRDDAVWEIRASRDDIAGRVDGSLRDLAAEVRAEAGGVAEVAL